MKMTIKLAPCPWCRKTPSVYMPIHAETWCWEVQCYNRDCKMKPKSPYVAIRNTAKTDLSRFMSKIDELCKIWSTDNPFPVKEATELDLTKIAKNFETKPAPDLVNLQTYPEERFKCDVVGVAYPYLWRSMSNHLCVPPPNVMVEIWDETTNNYGLGVLLCCSGLQLNGEWVFDQHYKGGKPTHWKPWERKS